MLDIIFPFIGGLGLFLTGMMFLSEGLVAFAGGALQKALVRFTDTPYKAFASGALITALVQSSTATTVTLIGFVSAGLITFVQAIGVVIGASLGNSVPGWIVASVGLKIKLGFYTLPLIGIGALLKLLTSGRSSELGRALAGFGMLFLGLMTLQEGMQSLSASFSLAHLPSGSYGAHILILLIGLVLTAILQSSSAAIAMTLTALHAQTINFDQAAAMVVGASIGTTLTGALVAIGSTIYAKRTALAYILFNVITGLCALALLPLFLGAARWTLRHFGLEPGVLGLTTFHSLFIIAGALVFLPLTPRFARLVERLIPDRGKSLPHHLDHSLLGVPTLALEASHRDLETAANQLFQLYGNLLNQTVTTEARHTLHQIRTLLNDAYEFVARIQPPQHDDTLNDKRRAQLHAIDHLLRLRNRLEHTLGYEENFKDDTYRWAIQQTRHMLTLAHEGLVGNGDENWVEQLAADAASLKSLLKEVRREVLTAPSLTVDASRSLHATDIYRWLERTGNHIWRICHYLNLSHTELDTDDAPPFSEMEETEAR